MNFACKLLASVVLLSSLVGCGKDDVGPTGSLKGQIQGNQLVSQVEVRAANGKVLTATPNSYGFFKLSGVPAGPVTVSYLPNPVTYPAVYFPPQPQSVTVTAGDTLKLPLLQPLYAEALSGKVSWTINGQHVEGQLISSTLFGEPMFPLPPRFYLRAQTTSDALTLAVAGISGNGTYSVNQLGAISYFDSPAYISYNVQQGSVTFTTYGPVSRRVSGAAQFRASGTQPSSNIPSGTSVNGSATFDIQY